MELWVECKPGVSLDSRCVGTAMDDEGIPPVVGVAASSATEPLEDNLDGSRAHSGRLTHPTPLRARTKSARYNYFHSNDHVSASGMWESRFSYRAQD